jgi:anti-anti-sigma factor
MGDAAEDVFSLTTSMRGRCRVVSVRGELDEVAAPVLDQTLEQQEGKPVIIDLSGLDFICSAGIHVLLRRRALRFVIVCPPGNVARVLGIVRAEKAALLFDDVDAAHDALSASLVGVA